MNHKNETTPTDDTARRPQSAGRKTDNLYLTPHPHGIRISLREALPVGTELAGFTILNCISEGRYATVFRARSATLEGEVALKIVGAEEENAAASFDLLVREFDLLNQVSETSHVVRVYDPRRASFAGLNLLLMPMEYADGGNLRHWMEASPDIEARMPVAIRLFREMCKGVEALHVKGIEHLDLKPENVLLFGRDKTAKVVDAGIARRRARSGVKLPPQKVTPALGTPGYMSPEQSAQTLGETGQASDIYSLGVILFELVTGRGPHEWKTIKGRSTKVRGPGLPAVRGAGSQWVGVVRRCLNTSPSDRYPSVEALINDLDRVERGGPDVSCPNCGHVNTGDASDLVKNDCQGCGEPLPDSFFRDCPECHASVRLDLHRCPRCSSGVAEYYRTKDLWADILKVKDEDPARAIDLVSAMLNEGLGSRQELLDLIHDLESIRQQVRALQQNAEEFSRQSNIEQAIHAWDSVLSLVPLHRLASREADRLRGLLDAERCAVATVHQAMDEARFAEAASSLAERLAITPGRADLKVLGKVCRKRESGHLASMKKAETARRDKRLYEVQQYLREALQFAPSDDAAARHYAHTTKQLERNEGLLTSARHCLETADFVAGDRALSEIEKIQSDMPALAPVRLAIDTTRQRYAASVAGGDKALASSDLTAAEAEFRQALGLCPRSQSAYKHLDDIRGRQAEAQLLFTYAIANVAAADFQTAEEDIRDALLLWATCPDASSAKLALKDRRDIFMSSMAAADTAISKGDLSGAESHLGRALEACPRATSAASQRSEVLKRQELVPPLMAAAETATVTADFALAWDRVREAERIWPMCPGLSETHSLVQVREKEYASHLAKADAAIAEGNLTLAERELEESRSISPGSVELEARASAIAAGRSEALPLTSGIRADCDSANFSSARARLAQIRHKWRSFPQLPEMEALVCDRETSHAKHMATAETAFAEGDLRRAEAEFRLALTLCTRSAVAQTRLDHLLNAKSSIPTLITLAEEDTLAARFESAAERLAEADLLCSGYPGLSSTKETTATCRKEYEQCMERVRHAAQEHRLDIWSTAAEQALNYCPHAEEAIAAKGAAEKSCREFEVEKRHAVIALRRAQFSEAKTHVENALRIWPGHDELRRQVESITLAESQFSTALEDGKSALEGRRFDAASAACKKALDVSPESTEASSLMRRIASERKLAEARRTRQRELRISLAKVLAVACATAVCIWLGYLLVSRMGKAFGGSDRQETTEPHVHRPLSARHGSPMPAPPQSISPATTRHPVRQVTLSNVSIPEDVIKAADVMAGFYAIAKTNGNVVVLSPSDALALETALQVFASGMDRTVRAHWRNGFDRFRRRNDGENPASFEAERQGSRREAFRQATAAFEEAAGMFGIPLVRNRNGQWVGPTWAYCVSQPIRPDGYKSSSRGGGVLKFDIPSRQYVGNRGNWIKLTGSAGNFNGNMSAFGGWVEMEVGGRTEADIYIGNRPDMRLDFLIIPAVQMDANSGNDGMHDVFSSRHGVILGRLRLRMNVSEPGSLFDVSCSASTQNTQELNWKGALNYDSIPSWPTTL